MSNQPSKPPKPKKLPELESSPLWKKAVALAEQGRDLAKTIPYQENYSFADPLYRMSLTIPADIAMAVGKDENAVYDYRYARGHLFTVKSLVLVAEKYGFAKDTTHFLQAIDDFGKLLDAKINELDAQAEADLKKGSK